MVGIFRQDKQGLAISKFLALLLIVLAMRNRLITVCLHVSTVGNTSTVNRANQNTTSLKVTVPEDIAKGLKLQPGDVVTWAIVEDKGKKFAKFRKLE